jgi:hypothetical protein
MLAVTSTHGLFVAVGEQGLRMVSGDGIVWKHAQTGKEGEVYFGICFGAGRFVALGTYGGDNLFSATTDGVTWQTQKRNSRTGTVRGIGHGKDLFLAIGGDAGFGSYAQPCGTSSPDGLKWSDFFAFPGKSILRRVAFGNGKFVGVGDSGRRAVSTDGRKWTDAPGVKAVDTLVDIVFGNGDFVGVGLHGLRMTSEDGLKWTDRQVGEEGEHLNSILWTGDRFVAVGLGATYFSADGRKWKREKNTDAPLTAAYGGSVFLGAHWKGRILRSDDAVKWKQVHKAEHHVEALAFGSLPVK